MRKAIILALGILVVVASACLDRQPAASPAPAVVRSTPPPVAPSVPVMLEHRGRMYRVTDLMDPGYRVESGDKFVKEFQPDKTIAWAGIDPSTRQASSNHLIDMQDTCPP